MLLAGARARLAPGDRTTLIGSLALLDQAEAIGGLAPVSRSGSTAPATGTSSARRAGPARPATGPR